MSLPEEAMNTLPFEDDTLPTELLTDWEPMECLGHGEGRETLLLRSRSDGRLAVAKCRPVGDKGEGSELLQNLNRPALPHFLSIYDGEQKHCVLREYIPGETLQDSAGNAPFSKEKTVSVLLQLCDVLEYLHSLNPPVIHRDIKPDNVILREDGSVALIDFGIARTYRSEAEQDTLVMGTAAFAPPEQYGFKQTDQRSDIYSLGVLAGWMLTGSTSLEDFAGIEDKNLRSMVAHCTAFDPANRYASAKEVSAALRNMQPPKKKNRLGSVIALLVFVLAVFDGLIFCFSRGEKETVSFKEPLIEEAVRMSLGKADGETLTEEELAAVEGLYIFGNVIAGNQNEFYDAASDWYASDEREHGSIITLEDIKYLPNLKYVMIAAENIIDISSLESLNQLEQVEFKHNNISDISCLKCKEHLSSVGLNDNPITDLSALLTLPSLQFLDLCDVSGYDGAVIESLGDMTFLDISNRTDSWQHLGTRSVIELKLGWTGIDSLEWLSGISGLTVLELQDTSITSLDGIEKHAKLETIRLSGNDIEDFTPLLSLPSLREVTLSEDQADNASVLEGSGITIIYE